MKIKLTDLIRQVERGDYDDGRSQYILLPKSLVLDILQHLRKLTLKKEDSAK